MIKNVHLPLLLKKISITSINSGIHTDILLFARTRRNTVRAIPHEPGIRHRLDLLPEDENYVFSESDENLLDDRLTEMCYGKNATESLNEEMKKKLRVQKAIISKKFFAPRPQPATLTYNERLCIKYLHKTDPLQWNVKTLSESFPATPDIIRKVLKSNVTYTAERAKAVDLKVQKNWELLAEGKLDADPDFIEHIKKFTNRREILLEQIKNEKFYLPEVKNEPVWNQGEMNNILVKYEKALKKLSDKMQSQDKHKMLSDEVFEEKELKKDKKSSLDLVYKKIEERITDKELETKDSFLLGDMINTYSNNITFEELQKKILRKAETKKRLNFMEKAILKDKLNVQSQENFTNCDKNKSSLRTLTFLKQEQNESVTTNQTNESTTKGFKKNNFKESDNAVKFTDAIDKFEKPKYPGLVLPNEKTLFTSETGISELLNKLSNESLSKDAKDDSSMKTEDDKKKAIDFSDPERLRREAMYYDKEVSDIKDTSFWNSGRTNNDKKMAELEKKMQEKPENISETNFPKGHVFVSEPYPERIKIPKKMQGSGLVFKVKDCYYDDDGEFLYRVPGMCK